MIISPSNGLKILLHKGRSSMIKTSKEYKRECSAITLSLKSTNFNIIKKTLGTSIFILVAFYQDIRYRGNSCLPVSHQTDIYFSSRSLLYRRKRLRLPFSKANFI